MAEIWPNLLPHKTFRADASLRQRLDSGHFLWPAFGQKHNKKPAAAGFIRSERYICCVAALTGEPPPFLRTHSQ